MGPLLSFWCLCPASTKQARGENIRARAGGGRADRTIAGGDETIGASNLQKSSGERNTVAMGGG